jgi:hypothetical protein
VKQALTLTLICAAASGAAEVVLSWETVTRNTDGTPITGAVTYRLYRGTKCVKETPAIVARVTVKAGQTWRVSAVVGGVEGAKSKALKITAGMLLVVR